ncbi:MAG: ABC transporter ATPase, partial [Fluviicola sp.]|nr:ABC transporter ATPase [Fluviicola sp.]
MFEQLPENSKVWVYQADRELNSSEESFLLENLKIFIQDWAAHGSQLYGDVAIKDMRFVILAVDESKTGVSGCSIDTSVRKIKDLGAEIKVDFFN